MLEIKTILQQLRNYGDFDKVVNTALAEGWELVRRDVITQSSDSYEPMLYAELERVIETGEEDEEPEDDGTAEWVVARDPAHPYRCNKCQASTSTPTPVCPECKRVMVSYRG